MEIEKIDFEDGKIERIIINLSDKDVATIKPEDLKIFCTLLRKMVKYVVVNGNLTDDLYWAVEEDFPEPEPDQISPPRLPKDDFDIEPDEGYIKN